MTGSTKDLETKSEWRDKLMAALKNRQDLARLSQIARNEIMSTEYLYRLSVRNTDGFTDNKMKAAGEEIDL